VHDLLLSLLRCLQLDTSHQEADKGIASGYHQQSSGEQQQLLQTSH
jgi:hypothetical protein